jgi:hypothetical protein
MKKSFDRPQNVKTGSAYDEYGDQFDTPLTRRGCGRLPAMAGADWSVIQSLIERRKFIDTE